MTAKQASEVQDTVIVGIGASAGGLDALQRFFGALPSGTGAAYVVVQHLSPDFKSLMSEILARDTDMPIVIVDETTAIQPDTIYMLRPGFELRVKDGGIGSVPRPDHPGEAPHPVDTLFETMVDHTANPAVAVVLSGTGTDGSRGIRRLKELGGIVFVQDPDTAEFDGMPATAIATGCADSVLEPEEIATTIARLVAEPGALSKTSPDLESSGPYERIIELIQHHTLFDLSSYKTGTISRRIERRMVLHHITEILDYVALLEDSPDEITQLARDCLIHVTYFFRDAASFVELEKAIRESFLEQPNRSGPYRVWVAGCSTGEEAYSVAAIVDHVIRDLGLTIDFKVFATDLDEAALSVASAANYPAAALVDVPAPYRGMFTQQAEGMYSITATLRNRVVFARHDILRDPPFPRSDLVTCRNVMIYFDTKAQVVALQRFLFTLRQDGLLFLGSSESAEPIATDVRPLNAKHRVFRRVTARANPVFDTVRTINGPKRREKAGSIEPEPLPRAAERLVELFASSGVVVDVDGELVHSFGEAERWLSIPRGMMSTNIKDLLTPETRSSVRLARRQARSSGEAVRINPVYDRDGVEAYLEVVHVVGDAGNAALDVILFREAGEAAPSIAVESLELDDAGRSHIENLERELATTRESLQSSIEELETTNEELQAVNEEMLASNEELQSTNEELHSVNEELYTVNSEHQQKIGELVDVTEDLEHLLHATEIGTLFLDHDLTIRRFTPSVRRAVPLRPEDIGRSLRELNTHLVDADLAGLVVEVIEGGEPREERFRTEDGTPLLVSIHPYRRGAAGGAVMSFVDVGQLEATDRDGLEAAELLSTLAETCEDVIWMSDMDSLQLRYVSSSFEDVSGYAVGSILHEPLGWLRNVHTDDRERIEKAFHDDVRTATFEAEYRIIRADGEERWLRDRTLGSAVFGGRTVVVGIAEDITRRVAADRERRRNVAMFRDVASVSPVPMIFTRPDGQVTWRNHAAVSYVPDPSVNLADVLQTDSDRAAWRKLLRDVSESADANAAAEVSWLHEESPRTCRLDAVGIADDDGLDVVVVQLADLTAHLSRAALLTAQAQELEAEARHDPLTGLLNRRGVDWRFGEVKERDRRRRDPMMAILIDCDKFKHFNDNHGYDTGDAVLRSIAERIRSTLRLDDIAGRVGGDEFLIILPATRSAEAAHLANKLRRAVSDTPVYVDGIGHDVTISAGVVQVADEHTQAEQVVAAAGPALHLSKSVGRNQVRVHTEGEDSARDELDELLEEGQVRVVRQTLNDTATGAVVGYELLSRGPEPWERPETLFDLFRRHDRLEELDLCCLKACLGSIDEPAEGVRYHVNVMPSSLLGDDAGAIVAMIGAMGHPEQVCLELSEQQFIGPSASLRAKLGELRELGVQIALDDVGFGRSALETLLAVEPDVVKIDRSMVTGIDENAGRRRDLARLVDLLGGASCELIAEGVETDTQREVLESLGVATAQGFLWSNPDLPVGAS